MKRITLVMGLFQKQIVSTQTIDSEKNLFWEKLWFVYVKYKHPLYIIAIT